MANQPSPPAARPPPDLPFDPTISGALSKYLRTFSLWCRDGFIGMMRSTDAAPGILIQAVDATTGAPINAVYMLSIKATAGPPPSAPTIVMTLIPSGSGKP